MEELLSIQQSLKVPKGRKAQSGKYVYRNCEDILEAVKPLQKRLKVEIHTTSEVINVGGHNYVKSVATIKNAKGETESAIGWAQEPSHILDFDSCQLTGMAMSYADKYALSKLFGLNDTRDIDEIAGTVSKPVDLKDVLKEIKKAKSFEEIKAIKEKYVDFSNNETFINELNKRCETLN